jgi:hypothetical protein
MKIRIIFLCFLVIAVSNLFAANQKTNSPHTEPEFSLVFPQNSTEIIKGIPITGAKFRVKNTSGDPLGDLSYRLSAKQNLFITGISASYPNSSLSFSASGNYSDITIQNLPAGGIAEFDISLLPGYCFVIPASKSINLKDYFSLCSLDTDMNCTSVSAFTFTPSALTIGTGAGFTNDVQVVQFLNNVRHTSQEAIPAAPGDEIVRFYILTNGSRPFNGNIDFESKDPAVSSFVYQNLEIFKSANSEILSSDYEGVRLNIAGTTSRLSGNVGTDIDAGEFLIIKERFKLYKCVENGLAEKVIRLGYGESDLCPTHYATPIVVRKTGNALLTIKELNLRNTDACRNPGGMPRQRSIVFRNDGVNTASDFRFIISSNADGLVPVSSIKVFIKKKNGTYLEKIPEFAPSMLNGGKEGPVLYSDLNAEQKAYFLKYFPTKTFDGSEGPSFTAIKYHLGYVDVFPYSCLLTLDQIYSGHGHPNLGTFDKQWYPVRGNCLPDDGNTLLAMTGVLRYIRNNDGNPELISLAPGDEIKITWDAYQCDVDQFYEGYAAIGAPYGSSGNDVTFNYINDGCTGEAGWNSTLRFGGNTVGRGYQLAKLPGKINLAGNSDKCINTSDGETEELIYDLQNIDKLTWQNTDNKLTPSDLGKLVFKVYLDDGLDLDQRLTRPANAGYLAGKDGNPRYGSLPAATAPAGTCPENVLTYDQETYSAVLVLKNGERIDLNPSLVADHRAVGQDPERLKFISGGKVKNAFYVYRLEFNLSRVFSGIVMPAVGSYNRIQEISRLIQEYLSGARLQITLRAYCPVAKKTGDDPKSAVHIVSLFEEGNCAETIDPGQPFQYTDLTRLAQAGTAYQINCPGCIIPGTNIAFETVYRKNLGFKDENRNGFADNFTDNTKPDLFPENFKGIRKFTKGDKMKVEFRVSMSDGDPIKGITTAQLTAPGNNIFLPYLYIRIVMPADVGAEIVPGSARVLFNGAVFGETVALTSSAASGPSREYVYKVYAGSQNFIQWPDLNFEAEYVLENSNSQAGAGVREASISAGYSTTGTVTSWSQLSDVIFCGDCSKCICNNMDFLKDFLQAHKPLFWCTNGALNFSYVPTMISFQAQKADYLADEHKFVIANLEDRSSTRDGCYFVTNHIFESITDQRLNNFDNEVRTFVTPGKPVKMKVAIPEGLKVTKIYIDNRCSQFSYEKGKPYSIAETYLLSEKDFPAYSKSIVPADQNNITFETDAAGKRYIALDFFYKAELENEKDSYSLFNNAYYTKSFGADQNYKVTAPYPGQLYMKDEYTRTMVMLIFSAENNTCTTFDPLTVWPEDYNYSNIPGLYTAPLKRDMTTAAENAIKIDSKLINNPAYLENPSTGTPYWTLTHWREDPLTFKREKPVLKVYSTDVNQDVTVDARTLNLFLKVVNEGSSGKIANASYPFLIADGSALEAAKGLKFSRIFMKVNGVYKELKNYPVVEKLTDAGRKIIIPVTGLPNAGHYIYDDYIKANEFHISNGETVEFKLVFDFSCNEINNSGCGDKGPSRGFGNLNITPGHGCYRFPAAPDISQSGYIRSCEIFNPLTYPVSTLHYGATASAVLQDGNGVAVSNGKLRSCNNYNYQIKVSSCQKGKISGYDVAFTVPEGLEITPPSGAAFTVAQNDGVYNVRLKEYSNTLYQKDIVLNFGVRVKCEFKGGLLKPVVQPLTDCNGILALDNDLSVALTDASLEGIIFDKVNINSLKISEGKVVVTYSAESPTIATNEIKISLPSGLSFTEGGENSKVISIPVGTIGNNLVLQKEITGSLNNEPVIKADLTQYVPVPCVTDLCFKPYVTSLTYKHICPVADAGPDKEVCAGTMVTIGKSAQNGISYLWTSDVGNFTSVAANPGVAPAQTTVYSLVVKNAEGCVSNPDYVKVVVNPIPLINLRTKNPDESTILCSNNSSVDITAVVTAPSGIKKSSWFHRDFSTGTETLVAENTLEVPANQTGLYHLHIIDEKGCENDAYASTINNLEMSCDGYICPGESPKVSITNLGGVIGQFGIQWKKSGSDNVLSTVPADEGDYIGYVVTKACTLATNPCNVRFKPVPAPYSIKPDGEVFILPGETFRLYLDNPDANSPDVADYGWSTGQRDNQDIIVNKPGAYSFTAVHRQSGCSISASRKILMPGLFLTSRIIGGNGSGGSSNCGGSAAEVNLRTNGFTISNASDIRWFKLDPATQVKEEITDPSRFSNSKSTVVVYETAYYEAEYTGLNGVKIGRMLFVELGGTPMEPTEILSEATGRFEGIKGCNGAADFESDYSCLSDDFILSDVNDPSSIRNENEIDFTRLIGSYVINYDPLYPGSWNRSMWTGYPFEGNGFMLVDGKTDAQRVWSKKLEVRPDQKFWFKASVLNIETRTFYNLNEKPEAYLLAVFRNKNNGKELLLRQEVQTRFFGDTRTWQDITLNIDINKTFPDIPESFDPTGFSELEVSLMMEGGGSIGRDMGIDDIRLVEYNQCSDMSSVLATSQRSSGSMAQLEISEKFTCYGKPVTLNATDVIKDPALNYYWLGPDGNIVDDGDGDVFSLSVNPEVTTTYTFNSYNQTTRVLTRQEATVNIITPRLEITADHTDLCLNQTVTFETNKFSGVSDVKYKWFINGTEETVTEKGFLTTDKLHANDVVYSELISGCKKSDGTELIVRSNSVKADGLTERLSAGEDKKICSGNSTTLTASGGFRYLWNDPAQSVSAEINVNPEETTTYKVIIWNERGCSETDEVTVTVTPAPGGYSISGDHLPCGNQKGLVYSVPFAEDSKYVWAFSGGTIESGQGTNSITVNTDNYPGNVSTPVQLTVTESAACGSTKVTQEVLIRYSPVADILTEGIPCFENEVTVRNSVEEAGVSYGWNVAGVTLPYLSYTVASEMSFVLTAQTADGCTGTDEIKVPYFDKPSADAGQDITICAGKTAMISGIGGEKYRWFNSSSDVISDNAEVIVSRALNGVLTLEVTDENGCIDSDEVFVGVFSETKIEAGEDQSICSGESLTLEAVTNQQGSFYWTGNDLSGNPSDRIQNISPVETGNYSVTFTDDNGCTASDEIKVTVNSVPVADAGADQNICAGSSAILSASGGLIYEWTHNPGSGSQEIEVSPAATTVYSVKVTDHNSCSAVDFVTVSVSQKPENYSISGPADLCQGDKGVNFTIPFRTASTYNWEVSGGSLVSGQGENQIVVDFGDLSEAVITVVEINSGPCLTDPVSLNLSLKAAPVVNLSLTGIPCTGNTVSIQNSVTESLTNYLWSPGATTGSSLLVNVNQTHLYKLTATGPDGCTASGEIQVNAIPLPYANAGDERNICGGNTTVLGTPGIEGKEYSWTAGGIWFSGTAQPVVTVKDIIQTYTVTVKDLQTTCTSSDQVIVKKVNGNPKLDGPSKVCPGQIYTYRLTEVENDPGTVTWNVTGGTIISSDNNYVTFRADSELTPIKKKAGIKITVTFENCAGSPETYSDIYYEDNFCPLIREGMTEVETSHILKLEIFPNPSTAFANLQITGTDAELVELEITDLYGRVTRKELIRPGLHEAFSAGLNPGVYFVKITDNGRVVTDKMILKL